MRLKIHPSLARSFLFCGLFVVSTSALVAQEEKTPSPHEPLLPRAPEMAAWTINYQYTLDKKDKIDRLGKSDKKRNKGRKNSEPGNNRITSIEIVKTGDIYHKVTHWETGAQNEAWSIKGRAVIKESADSQYVPMTANGPTADSYVDSDFEDLNWLSMKYYAGLKEGTPAGFIFRAKHKDRPLTRREKISADILKSLQLKKGELDSSHATLPQDDIEAESANKSLNDEDTVILDATTQMPVEYVQGLIKWTFQFAQPPTSQLEPPAEITKLLESWDNFTKSSTTTGSPP